MCRSTPLGHRLCLPLPSLLPIQTIMATSTTPEVMAGLQARIAARLASTNTFTEVRGIIQEFIGGNMDKNKEKVRRGWC